MTTIRAAAAALTALAASGCVTTEGPDNSVSIAMNAPRVVGAANAGDRAHQQLVAAFGGQYRSPRAERALADIVQRLVAASDEPGQSYQITILNSQTINAFALPSGRLYVTRGLLALANDTAEIAAVLSHEIAHVTARHAAARGEIERNADLVGRVSSDLLQDAAAGQQTRARSRLTLASFSRQQELEADQIGIRVMAKAGFDPYGSVRFLTSLGRSSAVRGARVDFLASHPGTQERIQKAILTARQIGGPGQGEQNRDAWLRAIEGMTYGEERGEGVIRGRRYVHPTGGFDFMAPEGFTLEASQQAVIGRAADGKQAMRFDKVAPPAGQSLEDYLKSGLLNDVAMENVQGRTVNGLTAATGVGRSRDWSYRLAVIEMDGALYRMLYSAQSLTADADRNFLASIDSFRRLTGDDARAVKLTKIGLVTASAGEDAATLAQRMATSERAPERFAILNGLDSAAAVRAGETYKLIVE